MKEEVQNQGGRARTWRRQRVEEAELFEEEEG